MAVRADRLRLLREGDHRFLVLIEESVLRNVIGGAEVMAGQLGHLITVGQCLKDWLATLSTQAETTRTGYRIMVRHIAGQIGTGKLARLKVRDVDFALAKLAERLSTRSVRLARMILIQAIRNAMVNDLVVRNVADLAAVPAGQAGRPSRPLTLEQALAVLDAAKGERLWPYVAVSMLGGIRTEEARAPRPVRGAP